MFRSAYYCRRSGCSKKYGELELLDITPSIEETEDMIFSILGDEDIQNVQAGKILMWHLLMSLVDD